VRPRGDFSRGLGGGGGGTRGEKASGTAYLFWGIRRDGRTQATVPNGRDVGGRVVGGGCTNGSNVGGGGKELDDKDATTNKPEA